MGYEEKLAFYIKNNLDKYFSRKNLKIIKIRLISERKDFLNFAPEQFFTRTYCCVLRNSVCKKIYVKFFSESLWKTMPEVMEIKKFNRFRDKLKIPKIYDLLPNINSLLMEEVKGQKLSVLFPIYFSPFLKWKHEKVIKKIIKEVAHSTAFLHNLTKKGKKSLRLFCLNTEIELVKKDIKGYNKLKRIIKELKEKKATITRVYADLKLDNIFHSKGHIKIADFTLRYSFFFLDPLKFSLNLELLQVYPYIKEKTVEKFKRIFYNEYLHNLNWKVEEDFLKKLEAIITCRNLIRAKRESVACPFLKKTLFKFYLDIFKKLLNDKLEKIEF